MAYDASTSASVLRPAKLLINQMTYTYNHFVEYFILRGSQEEKEEYSVYLENKMAGLETSKIDVHWLVPYSDSWALYSRKVEMKNTNALNSLNSTR